MNTDGRSLRSGTDHRTRWYPVRIDVWRHVLESMSFNGIELIQEYDIKSNIAYNLQYLEYLQQTIAELSLSEVLQRQTYKTYIIVATSVLESVLFHVVLAYGKKENNLFQIIELVKASSLLGFDPKIYKDLDRFRKLRNKVHITEFRNDLGTDYVTFDNSEFSDMQKITYEILTSTIFGLKKQHIDEFAFLQNRVGHEI